MEVVAVEDILDLKFLPPSAYEKLESDENDKWFERAMSSVKKPLNGTAKLQYAMLIQAVHDIDSWRVRPHQCEHAEAWVKSPIDGYVFSFLAICERFELDPEATRKALKLRKNKEIKLQRIRKLVGSQVA